ncbi:hypothetical protein GIX45_06915 [Erwinia sp. CPCC 100877]|nr:hypothetical protein [Erwinia sp. CPCC 100877]
MMIWFIVFFIISQIMMEKNWLPKKVLELRLLPLCLASIGTILLAVVIGIIIGHPVFVVGTITILCGSMISWRYRTFGAGLSEKK